jgi:hypothetical protein
LTKESEYHWSEGMKYALECIKGMFFLNGAASISMLTFVGNLKTQAGQFVADTSFLIYGLLCFAFGALAGPIAFCLAYLTQLYYGNDSITGKSWSAASKFHVATYVVVLIGMILFVVGISLTASGLFKIV